MTSRHSKTAALAALVAIAATGCATSPASTSRQPGAVPSPTAAAQGTTPNTVQDTAGADLVPAGYGSLRQDDIGIKVGLPAVNVRAVPLDESVIRLLSPDSYRALRDLVAGQRDRIASISQRYGQRRPSLWYVSFYGLQPDARFSPTEFGIQSAGREFRPLDFVPLTTGFGEQRIGQRETQSAIFVFDEGVNVSQPLTVTIGGITNDSWGNTLQTIERERSLVRSRAAHGSKP